jgi:hypothetical protein
MVVATARARMMTMMMATATADSYGSKITDAMDL